MRHRNRPLIALFAALALPVAGCNPSIAPPNLFNPGPTWLQRQKAVQFDPYPDQDAGPEVQGGRPLDYDRQIPEVERSRFFMPNGTPAAQRNPGSWLGRRTMGGPAPAITPTPPPGYPQQ